MSDHREPSKLRGPRRGRSARVRFFKRLRLGRVAVFGLVSLAGLLLWIYKPVDEWLGLAVAAFDSGVAGSEKVPPGASRVFYYGAGFTDWAHWVAFSADRATIKSYLTEHLKLDEADLADWPLKGTSLQVPMAPGGSLPINPPGRASWRNRGYWEVSAKSSGKVFAGKGPGLQQLFYDTTASRLYFFYAD